MYIQFKGAQQLRQRIANSLLSGKLIRISDIRSNDSEPGLRDYEASYLRLIEKVTNGSRIDINVTGTTIKFKPGVITGGSGLSHECGTTRSIGYFIEGLLLFLPFGKAPTQITFRGITNDESALSVDTLRTVTLPFARKFGIEGRDGEALALKVVRRGAPPRGGGQVVFDCPIVKKLQCVQMTELGRVRRVRGVAYTTKVSPQVANRIVDATKGVLTRFLPDVYIYTDHYKGVDSGLSPGYGLSLVAETTSGVTICTEGTAQSKRRGGDKKEEQDTQGLDEVLGVDLASLAREDAKTERPIMPEEIGQQVAHDLLREVRSQAPIDQSHTALAIFLMAVAPQNSSKIRVAPPSQQTIQLLRDIKEFYG
eukprot:CAMPEP_0113888708 /NCGR_PEP_ID=MMETSP0780_2-20120614/13033_1 /TAXON_ID=652834 /ORGANISM="Palpitomonas bilix" /LENGTH=366 /DNA_ID=CAMNT_0000877609 /DNA_START=201 /DNA_END=1297 /DNA_ORIENTATION=- /assembly_acc=CAM_ASM_000599